MIADSIEHLDRYALPQTTAILKFLKEHDAARLPDGEIEIEGRQLFVRIMSYTPKPASENRFEIHRVYADVQYMIKGVEIMQLSQEKDLVALGDYDFQGDYQFFKPTGPINNLIVPEGQFIVFYPNEAHRPSCSYLPISTPVKKLVFKVKIDQET